MTHRKKSTDHSVTSGVDVETLEEKERREKEVAEAKKKIDKIEEQKAETKKQKSHALK